jgi:hypothetical protein
MPKLWEIVQGCWGNNKLFIHMASDENATIKTHCAWETRSILNQGSCCCGSHFGDCRVHHWVICPHTTSWVRQCQVDFLVGQESIEYALGFTCIRVYIQYCKLTPCTSERQIWLIFWKMLTWIWIWMVDNHFSYKGVASSGCSYPLLLELAPHAFL